MVIQRQYNKKVCYHIHGSHGALEPFRIAPFQMNWLCKLARPSLHQWPVFRDVLSLWFVFLAPKQEDTPSSSLVTEWYMNFPTQLPFLEGHSFLVQREQNSSCFKAMVINTELGCLKNKLLGEFNFTITILSSPSAIMVQENQKGRFWPNQFWHGSKWNVLFIDCLLSVGWQDRAQGRDLFKSACWWYRIDLVPVFTPQHSGRCSQDIFQIRACSLQSVHSSIVHFQRSSCR